MKSQKDNGMTLLEVTIALTILLIGIGFIAKSDSVSNYYRAQHELRQQMVFYAAGIIEAKIEGYDLPPFNNLNYTCSPQNYLINDQKVKLQEIQVTVTASNAPSITLSTYRMTNTP